MYYKTGGYQISFFHLFLCFFEFQAKLHSSLPIKTNLMLSEKSGVKEMRLQDPLM